MNSYFLALALNIPLHIRASAIIALVLICGGSLPHFLSQAVLSYVLYQTMDTEIVDEIPKEDCKDQVKKVCRKY